MLYIHNGVSVSDWHGTDSDDLMLPVARYGNKRQSVLNGRNKYSTTIGRRQSAWCTCCAGAVPLSEVGTIRHSGPSMWEESIDLSNVPANTPFSPTTDEGRYATEGAKTWGYEVATCPIGGGLTAVWVKGEADAIPD